MLTTINRHPLQAPPAHDLSILDQLSPPNTVEDLEMQINAWKDCRMFFPIGGQPRAWMEFPVMLAPDKARTLANATWGGNPEFTTERWVYSVYSIHMRGTAKTTQGPLCRRAWADMLKVRKFFAEHYGDMQPLIIWRRNPEMDQTRAGDNRRYYRLYMRFAVPGVDLQRAWADTFLSDSSAGSIEIFK
jgi:hypothetical protein